MTMSVKQDFARTPENIPAITLSLERVAEVLNLETSEVYTQLRSIDGRKKLLADLQKDPDRLASVIDPESLKVFQGDLDAMQHDLAAEQAFLEAQNDPAKKGMFRRAWDTVAGFPRKHPFITVTLLGVVLGVVASYMGWLPRINFSGLWGRAQGLLGFGTATTAEAAAGDTAGAATAYDVGETVLPAGVEVPLGTLDRLYPEALRIRIFDHSFLYNNEVFTMEQLPELLKKLPEISVEQPLKILRYPSSRTTAEIALQEMLQSAGISTDKIRWAEDLIQKEFIPKP